MIVVKAAPNIPLHRMENGMTESKNDFRVALGSVIDARGRESSRQVSYRMQHQLIGAFTKRP
jgi:hypothetical protein